MDVVTLRSLAAVLALGLMFTFSATAEGTSDPPTTASGQSPTTKAQFVYLKGLGQRLVLESQLRLCGQDRLADEIRPDATVSTKAAMKAHEAFIAAGGSKAERDATTLFEVLVASEAVFDMGYRVGLLQALDDEIKALCVEVLKAITEP